MSSVNIAAYLPADRLEHLLQQEFQDEVREDPITFNKDGAYSHHSAQGPVYPFDLIQRREILEHQKESLRLADIHRDLHGKSTDKLKVIVDKYQDSVNGSILHFSSPKPSARKRSRHITDSSDNHQGATSDYHSVSNTNLSSSDNDGTSGYGSLGGQTASQSGSEDRPQKLPSSHGNSSEYTGQGHLEVMGPQRRRSSVKLGKTKSTSASRRRGGKKKLSDLVDSVKMQKEEEDAAIAAAAEMDEEKKKMDQLRQREEEERKKKYPVAPDGYIPNSIVRKQFTLHKPKPPSPPSVEQRWTLKPVPVSDPRHLPGAERGRESNHDVTLYLSDTSMSNPLDNDDEDDISTLSDRDTTTHINNVTSRESTRLSGVKSTAKKTITKSGQKEAESKVSKQHQPLSRDGTLNSPQTEVESSSLHPLLRQIGAESWFPKSISVSLPGVVSAFIAILDNVNNSTHRQICDYINQVKQDLGYPPGQELKLIQRLVSHLSNRSEVFRGNAARTLGLLGNSSQEVIVGLLPLLTDLSDDVRTEAQVALQQLTGVDTKEGLYKLLEEIKVIQEYNSRDDENLALEAIASRLLPCVSDTEVTTLPPGDQIEDKVESWLEDAKGIKKDMTGLYNEKGDQSSSKSGPRGHMTGITSKGSRASRGGPRSVARGSDGKKGPSQESASQDTRFSGKEVDRVPVSSVIERQKTGMFPNNPVLYKMYDSQREAQGGTTSGGPQSVDGSTNQLPPGVTTDGSSSQPDSTGIDQGKSKRTSSSSVVSLKLTQESCDSQRDSGHPRSDQKTSGSGSTKITRFEDSQLRTPLTEADSGMGHSSDNTSTNNQDRTGTQHRGRSGLSPVISSNVEEAAADDSVTDAEEENWRQFFQRPSAQERRLQQFGEGSNTSKPPTVFMQESPKAPREPISLPPIRYLADDVELVAGDPGLRLLHSITVKPKGADSASSEDERLLKRHKIDAIPGKLGSNTTTEDFGSAQYGILDLHWTTGIPRHPNMCRRYLAHRSNDQQSHLGNTQGHLGNTQGYQANTLAATTFARQQTLRFELESEIDMQDPQKLQDDKLFPSLKNEDTPFVWEKPLPPPPDRESRLADSSIKQQHRHYCDYYRLLKKRMHQHISLPVLVTPSPPDLPEVKAAIKVKDTLPPLGGQSKVTQQPSHLLPLVSWRAILTCDI